MPPLDQFAAFPPDTRTRGRAVTLHIAVVDLKTTNSGALKAEGALSLPNLTQTEIPISSPPSPSGGGRGRLPIRGRSRRGPPRRRRPTARRPPIRGRAVNPGRETLHRKNPPRGGWLFYNLPNFPYGKGGFDVSGGGGVRCHRASSR
jgi:hypothetical protein